MHTIPVLFGLAVAAAASNTLHYTIPNSLKAATSNCTLPAEFAVANFTTYTDKEDESLNTVSFEFSDPDTGIRTTCQRDATSTPSGPSKNKYGCDNDNVGFIYQTTGIAGLTITEKACPSGGTPKLEASGLLTPELECADTADGTLCRAKQDPLQGDFDSLQPIQPKVPVRRGRGAWRA
ncbi:hypothetical protein F4802DRAFT_601217 [Xylaria palmicola]|nr:hypothetical protein F4802DRAFT_601217 [Xylaria palmicola]